MNKVSDSHLELTLSRKTSGRAGVSRMTLVPVLVACLPAILFLAATFLLPIFSTLRLSFSTWPGVGPVKWVGLKKYSELISNPDFHSSIKITIVFAILSTAGGMVTAILMGLAASRKMSSDGMLRAIWFLPAIAPATAMAVFWTISVQPQIGVVTQLFS